nr:hypothetical protein [uncultured Deefgea sp.]
MTALNCLSVADVADQELTLITAKSGMQVNVPDREWKILPNTGKGHTIPVAWIHDSLMSAEDKELILEVLIDYVRTKNANTASGIVSNTKPYLADGIPTLTSIRTAWSGLKTNNKKGLNQFFGTLSKLGHKRFDEYHQFTTSHLDKSTPNILDPEKGALSDIEFDSLAKEINAKLRAFDWSVSQEISFFIQSSYGFGGLRDSVSNKLMLSIVRRPIQLAALKWADLIPAGASFNDSNIKESDHIGSTGIQTLQLRVFHAKVTGGSSPRAFPELYPLHLSNDLSTVLINYKKIYMTGVMMYLKSGGVSIDQEELLRVMMNMPIFLANDLFSTKFDSLEIFKSMFTSSSMAFHVSEQVPTSALRTVKIVSDRLPDCIATNNRIRHTVLTRGAQEGRPATQLARMTGVTVPAARHYVDMDYQSRVLIDQNYLGNEFLKQAFKSTISLVATGEELVLDQQFNEVGGVTCKTSCRNCHAELGRPLACYGCPNFRPILEAEHRSVLQLAEDKLSINKSALLNPLHTRSIEKLQRQIEWVKLTITICDEMLSTKRSIDVKSVS